MPGEGFVVAMRARITRADYDAPARVLGVERAWLIVSRFGAAAEYLTIASAAPLRDPREEVPTGLQPRETLCAILASEDAAKGRASFLIVRRPPAGFTLAGTFFPAEGYVDLARGRAGLRIEAWGRHAHSVGTAGGVVVRKDVPDPAPDAGHALSWHIRGARAPWCGEFMADPDGRTRGARRTPGPAPRGGPRGRSEVPRPDHGAITSG